MERKEVRNFGSGILSEMKEIIVLNPENASDEECQSYPIREAARAVVLDKDGKIALLHVSSKNYYKLPGGGVEEGEDNLIGLQRECKEEIGCDVEVKSEIGMVVEYRKIFNLKQISYCYFAHVKGVKGEPKFTEYELQGGFEIVWSPYAEAEMLIAKSLTDNPEGRMYIIPRDTAILEAAKDHFVS